MKSESIKHITDIEKLSDLYSSLFIDRDVFLKTDGINIRVEFVRFSSGKIYLRVPVQNYEFKRTAIYTRSIDEVAYSHIIPLTVEDDLYVFETEGSQIYFAPRREKRFQINEYEGQKVTASNLISGFVIRESLMQNQARIDWLRQEILSGVSKGYNHVSVHFLGDGYSDIRMSRIMDEREPIFITDIRAAPESEKECAYSEEYTREIYYHDTVLRENNLVSEITVPLMYKMMMPFGYIQVNSTEALSAEEFFMIKRLGMAYSESLSKDRQLFKPSADTITICDLSSRGLGMIFKEKNLRHHFREDTLISFTAFFPDGKNASILARVISISLNGEEFRVGCTIENIDAEGRNNYNTILDTA